MRSFERIKSDLPAFPTENERQTGENDYHYSGLTKREYFAAQSLTAITMQCLDHSYVVEPKVIKCAIEVVDEMLRQLGE